MEPVFRLEGLAPLRFVWTPGRFPKQNPRKQGWIPRKAGRLRSSQRLCSRISFREAPFLSFSEALQGLPGLRESSPPWNWRQCHWLPSIGSPGRSGHQQGWADSAAAGRPVRRSALGHWAVYPGLTAVLPWLRFLYCPRRVYLQIAERLFAARWYLWFRLPSGTFRRRHRRR